MITTKKRTSGKGKKRVILAVIIVLLLATAGAGGYVYWQKTTQPVSAASATPEYYTATARQGNLTLSATGSGSLAAGKTVNLFFPVDGRVGALNVKVGDLVTAGQELATLADTSDLQIAVTAAKLDLSAAKLALETLKGSASASIATAQLAVATADKAVTDAKSEWVDESWQRCDQETTDLYYSRWIKAQEDLTALGDGGGNLEYYNTYIVPAKNKVTQAYSSYQGCLKFTDYEVDSSHANLTLAEAELKDAQAELDLLLANNGIDPDELTSAENNVALAETALKSAQAKLDGATLVALFDGTVMNVAAEIGDEVDSAASYITISDLLHPVVEFSVDETDADKVNIGAQVQIVFDALPDDIFIGEVTQVDPMLQTVSNYLVLSSEATLDLTGVTLNGKLLPGMSATVEVISGIAENAVLVPVEALRDLGDGTYSVLVVGNDGTPKLRVVEVGLMDATYAQITSGLTAGEIVTTGAVETQ